MEDVSFDIFVWLLVFLVGGKNPSKPGICRFLRRFPKKPFNGSSVVALSFFLTTVAAITLSGDAFAVGHSDCPIDTVGDFPSV